MRRLFEALDVDYPHWKALTLTALKIDLRASRLGAAQFGHQEVKAAGLLIGQFIFYSAMGVAVALLVWFSRDLFLAATTVVTYVMFMIATTALLDHNAAIVSPDDHAILGFRPLTSRTYFAARLANMLVYTTVMTTVFSYVPIVAFFVRHGVAVGFAAIMAVYASSTATALTMAALYGWLVRTVGPDRLKRTLSYVQFIFSFFVYGGYFALSRVFQVGVMTQVDLPKSPWLLMLPPVWFASYVEIAAGRTSLFEIVPALASLAALIGLTAVLGGKLSLEYADRLAALTTVAAPVVRSRRRLPVWLFTRDEARAAALLIRSQFRNDLRFRMGVLTILPLTIVYLLMGVHDGGIGDPFDRSEMGQGMSLVTMAVFMFPTMLKINLVRSETYRASWIFFTTPADHARVVRASKDILVVMFLLPYLAVVGGLLAWFTTNILHLAVHLLVVALTSHLVLQIVTFVEPELPFSKPLVKGSASSKLFVVMFVVMTTATILPFVAPFVYQSTVATVMFIGLLVIVSVALDRITQLRVEAQTAGFEFQG